MIKKLLGDKYSRANNIAKSVRSLQRVPEKERPRIVKKAVFNIYVIGSIIILISLWLYFFGNEVSSIPLIFIFGIPLLIRNYIIKRIVDKEFPKDKKLQ